MVLGASQSGMIWSRSFSAISYPLSEDPSGPTPCDAVDSGVRDTIKKDEGLILRDKLGNSK